MYQVQLPTYLFLYLLVSNTSLAWSTVSERYKTNKFEHVLTKAVEVNKQLQLAAAGKKRY